MSVESTLAVLDAGTGVAVSRNTVTFKVQMRSQPGGIRARIRHQAV